MYRGIALLCLVAACGGGEGIELDVRPGDSSAQTVELLISLDECSTEKCNAGVAWGPDGAPAGRINVLYRDAAQADDPAFIAPVDADGFARFRIQLASDVSAIARIGIVAYDAQQKPVGMEVMENVTIPKHHAEYWHIALDAVKGDASTDGQDPPGASGEHRAHVWHRMKTGQASCAALQTWSDDKQRWLTEYFSPEQDADCDDEQIECNAYWWNYNKGQPASACFAPIGPSMACVIGLSQCADGVSADGTCKLATNPFCFPDQICSDCAQSVTGTCVRDSVIKAINDMTNMPRFLCGFSPDTLNGTMPCPNNGSARRITLPVGNCSDVKLAPVNVPMLNPQSQVTVNGAVITTHVMTDGTRCDIDLFWTQGPTSGVSAADFLMLVAYGTNHLVFPLRLAIESPDTCPVQATVPALCESPQLDVNSDKIWRCAMP